MDRFSGRTVVDSTDGYALIETRRNNHPRTGEPAPEICLPLRGGTGTLALSSFRGKRPVVLIFGSLT